MSLTIKTGMDLKFHLSTLLHRNDRMGMMHSIESRFPFLDEELIKLGLNLPVKWKIKFGFTYFDKYHPFIKDKFILRHIAESKLPKNISNAPKRGFPINIKDRLRFKSSFFKSGYLSELLSLSKKESEAILNINDNYLLKLITIEIFGRLFSLNFNVDETKDFLSKNVYLLDEKNNQMQKDIINQNPIFIVGFPRSGTTLLQKSAISTEKFVFISRDSFFCNVINKINYNENKSIKLESLDEIFKRISSKTGHNFNNVNEHKIVQLASEKKLTVKILFELLVFELLQKQKKMMKFPMFVGLKKRLDIYFK